MDDNDLDPTAGTVDEVLDRVGDDVEVAQRTLTAEQAKGGDARSTLVAGLERIVNPPGDDAGSDDNGDVGPEVIAVEPGAGPVPPDPERERIGPEVFRVRR